MLLRTCLLLQQLGSRSQDRTLAIQTSRAVPTPASSCIPSSSACYPPERWVGVSLATYS